MVCPSQWQFSGTWQQGSKQTNPESLHQTSVAGTPVDPELLCGGVLEEPRLPPSAGVPNEFPGSRYITWNMLEKAGGRKKISE
jgi:hypothetical protein